MRKALTGSLVKLSPETWFGFMIRHSTCENLGENQSMSFKAKTQDMLDKYDSICWLWCWFSLINKFRGTCNINVTKLAQSRSLPQSCQHPASGGWVDWSLWFLGVFEDEEIWKTTAAFCVLDLWSCLLASHACLSVHLDTELIFGKLVHWPFDESRNMMNYDVWWMVMNQSDRDRHENPLPVVSCISFYLQYNIDLRNFDVDDFLPLRSVELCCSLVQDYDCNKQRLNHSVIKFFGVPLVIALPSNFSTFAELGRVWCEPVSSSLFT